MLGAAEVCVVVTWTGAVARGAAGAGAALAVGVFAGVRDGDGLAVAEVLPAAGGLLAGCSCADALTLAVAGGLPLATAPCPLHPAIGKTIRAATIRPQALADLFMCIPHPIANNERVRR